MNCRRPTGRCSTPSRQPRSQRPHRPVAREIKPTPPAGVTRGDERLAPGWPLVLVMAGGALCLARLGFFGPLALLLVLGALATALGWISDESDRRRRRRHKS